MEKFGKILQDKIKSFYINSHENVNGALHVNIEMEIVLVKSGEIKMKIEEKDYLIKQNQGIFVFPFEKHDFKTENKSTVRVLMFTSPYTDIFFKNVSENYSENRIFNIDDNLSNWIFNKTDEPIKYNNLTAMALLNPLFLTIKNECVFIEEKKYSDKFLQALGYINRHLFEDISLTEVSNKIGIHHVSLSRLFSKYGGMNFTKYVNFRRIIIASHFIEENNNSITDIAYETGFESIRNFNRIFFEYFKCTPTEYKKRLN